MQQGALLNKKGDHKAKQSPGLRGTANTQHHESNVTASVWDPYGALPYSLASP
jgi:hypothetical protein